ncbi:MAG: DUF3800 domain-containing protein [Sedimentisphaerales bacterium]|nr:DUF3800 domain-containing protein [Sedimentisphaerales bacterium]
MNLIYLDESGNTGLNLKDSQQPVFLLAAMILPESKWFSLEKLFFDTAKKYFGHPLPSPFEIQAKDLKSGRGLFKNLTFPQQLSFRDEMLQLLLSNKVGVIYRRIIKSKFAAFCEKHYGSGIKVNPYIMALPFVCMEVDHYLRKYEENELGMRVSDIDKQTFSTIKELVSTGIGSNAVDILEWTKKYYIK